MFPRTSSENIREMETTGFLKNKEHNVVTSYKVGADSHDNERVVRPEHYQYLAGGKRNLKISTLSPLVICSSGAKIFYADFRILTPFFQSIGLYVLLFHSLQCANAIIVQYVGNKAFPNLIN